MKKIYNRNKDVYDALQERLDFVFNNFKYVYVCFSGGKDSGILLNAVLDYKREHKIKEKIGVLYRDYECDYSYTQEYVKDMIESNIDDIEPYWICVPCSIPSPVSQDKIWKPWDPELKDKWCREMPQMPYVVNMDNIQFEWDTHLCSSPFYDKFGKWYAKQKGESVFGLNGMRAIESLHRYAALTSKKKCMDNQKWTRIAADDLVVGMPLYDWTVNDIWYCYYKFGYKYNKMYDLFYKAGVSQDQMRIGIPFLSFSHTTLQLFKILEPEIYDKFLDRIDGVNFSVIYGSTEAMARNNNIILPAIYNTYRDYLYFLLETLDIDTKNKFIHKFEILKNNCKESEIPFDDNMYKKCCCCILKNDYECSSLDISTMRYQKSIKKEKRDFAAIMFGGKKNGK